MNKIITLAVFGLLAGGIGTTGIANAQAPGFGMGPQMGRPQSFGMQGPQAAGPQAAQRGPQAVGPQQGPSRVSDSVSA